MQADVGDRLVVKGRKQGQPDRHAVIVEVQGPNGRPPYVVRWTADGHTSWLIPGSDAVVEHGQENAG